MHLNCNFNHHVYLESHAYTVVSYCANSKYAFPVSYITVSIKTVSSRKGGLQFEGPPIGLYDPLQKI